VGRICSYGFRECVCGTVTVMAENIAVAVRVRPLNEREQAFHPVPGWVVDSKSNELVQLDENGVPTDTKYAYGE